MSIFLIRLMGKKWNKIKLSFYNSFKLEILLTTISTISFVYVQVYAYIRVKLYSFCKQTGREVSYLRREVILQVLLQKWQKKTT